MKINIKKNQLLTYLNKVGHIVNPKSPIESLNGIYFKAEDNQLSLIGSDADISIKTIVKNDLEIKQTGSVVLPKLIVEIIRKIDGDMIEIEVKETFETIIKSKKSKFKLHGIDPNNYPNIDFSLDGDFININTNSLEAMINETIFAASKEEVRPVLTGINASSKDNELTFIATDSYRMSKKSCKIDSDYNFNINIPAKCLVEVNKLLHNDKDVNIYISNSRILFNFSDSIIQSRLINGSYPEIGGLIPNEFKTTIKLSKSILQNALERANILSFNANFSSITLSKKEDKLEIYSNSQEVGSVNEEIDYLDYQGEEISLSFNSRYVSEALKSFKEEIYIYLNDAMSPFIIKSDEEYSSIQLILPLKTH